MTKQIGIIAKLTGNVEIIKSNGARHRAAEGDSVYEGDKVVTYLGSGVTVLDSLGVPLNIEENKTVALDHSVMHTESTPTATDSAVFVETVIQALDRGQDLSTTLDPTAAGLGAGDGGGHSFVMLGRILESVNPNHYAYGYDPLGILPIVQGIGEVHTEDTVATVEPTPPVVNPVPPTPEPPIVQPEEPEPEEPEPEEPEDDKEHKDNGKGNGVDPAPGGSGNHNGDNADGSNTPGTDDTKDDHTNDDKPTDNSDPKDDTEGEDQTPPEEEHEDDAPTDDKDEGDTDTPDEDVDDTVEDPSDSDETEDSSHETEEEDNSSEDNESDDEEDSEDNVNDQEDKGNCTPDTRDTDNDYDSGTTDSLPSPIDLDEHKDPKDDKDNSRSDSSDDTSHTDSKGDVSPCVDDPININDLLTDGKHELEIEDDKEETTTYNEDKVTHESVHNLSFDVHVDHTVQNVIDELTKHHEHDN